MTNEYQISKSPFFWWRVDSLISEYPWNEKNNTFTWLSSLSNSIKKQKLKVTVCFRMYELSVDTCRYLYFFEIWLIRKLGNSFFNNNSVALGQKAVVTNQHGRNSKKQNIYPFPCPSRHPHHWHGIRLSR